MARSDRRQMLPGSPFPLGATSDGLGTNFAVFSANAEKIELCLFSPAGRREMARYALPECTDQVWHGYLPDVHEGQLYGYRAYGPYLPEQGHRFNPNKLLLDPYSRRLFGKVRWTDALYGYRLQSNRADLSFDRRDSAPAMPKSVVTESFFNWGDDEPPAVPWEKTVIYEAHVRGMSMRAGHIRAHERGTFAALGSPYVIDHLVKLGITAIELLPVHAYLQDRRLMQQGLSNYWGYNTLSFFSPEPRYLSDGTLNEMRRAIRRLHRAGIEVILDVVYNHTCEEGELGPTLFLRGLDNATYYRLNQDNPRYLVNETGCGNTLNLAHPRVLQMVMDSLRYWVREFHVDGFRFDLGVVLGRDPHRFDPGSGFFDAVRQDPELAHVKLISEPWDLGTDGYQVGNHPPGFAEWNDRFRDEARSFWKGDPSMRKLLAGRLLGSAEQFNRGRRRPWASVNFVTAHDGFTLQDLVSYNEKHNEANGESNKDGTNDNRSFNWGTEGRTEDPGTVATRERIKRALLMTLFFSNGTPMMLGGDEFGRSQNGNNNAYCQDNELSWFDWSLAESDAGKALINFTRRCIEVRQERPSLRATRFFTAEDSVLPGVPDTGWFDEHGVQMRPEMWDNPEGRTLALRRISRPEGGHRRAGTVAASLLLLNASTRDRDFILPPPEMTWHVAIDAAEPVHDRDAHAIRRRLVMHNKVHVAAHSAVLLVADHVAD